MAEVHAMSVNMKILAYSTAPRKSCTSKCDCDILPNITSLAPVSALPHNHNASLVPVVEEAWPTSRILCCLTGVIMISLSTRLKFLTTGSKCACCFLASSPEVIRSDCLFRSAYVLVPQLPVHENLSTLAQIHVYCYAIESSVAGSSS